MKAVIFDLDDTLFDHTGAATAAVNAWVTSFGPRTDQAELIAEWFEIERRQFDAWLAGRFTHQGQRRARLRDFLPLLGQPVPGTDAELDAVFEGYLKWYRKNWIAFDDARPALEFARGNGWRVGVLTNGSTIQQNAKLAAIGLAELVDVVATSESLGASKPAAAAYHETCRLLGVEPGACVMIGDNLDADVLGARSAGLTAYHLDRRTGTTLDRLLRDHAG